MTKKEFDNKIEEQLPTKEKIKKDFDYENKFTEILKLMEKYIGSDRMKLLAVRTEWEASWNESLASIPYDLMCTAITVAAMIFGFLGALATIQGGMSLGIIIVVGLVLFALLSKVFVTCSDKFTKASSDRKRYIIKMNALKEYEKKMK